MSTLFQAKRYLLICLVIPLLLLSTITAQKAAAASLSQQTLTQYKGVKPFANEGSTAAPAWAGYEAVDWNTYRQVDGEWNVANVHAPNGASYGDAAQWIGFNGDLKYEVPDDYQGPLVQVGTESAYGITNNLTCLQGISFKTPVTSPEYYAWVEVVGDTAGHSNNNLFPNASGYYCGSYLFAVNPGDDIVASINVPANSYVPGNSSSCRQHGTNAFIAVQDKTTGSNWSTTFTNNAYNDARDGMCAFNADWILERTGNDANTAECEGAIVGPECPGILANFNQTSFYHCYLDTSGGNGYGITYHNYKSDTMNAIDRTENPSGHLLAAPGSLYNNGTAFNISFDDSY